jgi:uncharacterized protein YjbI with pentapeptide repeats
LGTIAGLLDLRGLPAPVPQRLARFEQAGWFFEKLGNLIKLEEVTLQSLDLSGASLEGFRLRKCVVENCKFDEARCHDWRMWESRISNTSFRSANLRDATLGPWADGKGNAFTNTDFTEADFKNCSSITAVFEDCIFSFANLSKVEFLRCGIVRCNFSGILDETVFDGRVFQPNEREPNRYEEVDMLNAVLKLTQFWGIDLPGVKLPNDPELRVIGNYPRVITTAVEALRNRNDETGRVLRAILSGERGVERGYPFGLFNRADWVLLGGEELAELADTTLRKAEDSCRGSR